MTSRNNKPIIEVKHLSKEYQIGMDRTYKRFTESFTNAVRHPVRTLRGLTGPKETFWALKDINFEVERGEVLGIIGRNGAGKSTLLKILSRITYPTEGEIVMRGRVGSLLEVGTGFHPELTGRENIYFNGAILGMKKREIEEKFEEIVKFSGVEKFLDTPVKRYSSGMNVRLAFSVAAHLDPEILLVDEVLAVGDAEFQKKCLGKMGEVAEGGRTVLFVSHNMAAIQSLCNLGIHVKSGKVNYFGEIQDVVNTYLADQISLSKVSIQSREDRHGAGHVRITSFSITAKKKENKNTIMCGDSLRVGIQYKSSHTVVNVRFIVAILNFQNVPLFRLDSDVTGDLPYELPKTGWAICETGPLNATPGPCYINVAIFLGNELQDHVIHAANLTIEPNSFYPTGKLFEQRDSLFLLEQQWRNDEN